MGIHCLEEKQGPWGSFHSLSPCDHRGVLPRQLWWSMAQLRTPRSRTRCPGFLLGFLLKVSTFGLIIDFVENEALAAPTDWELFQERITQQTTRATLVVVTILTNPVLKFKEKIMLFQYGSNLTFIYALFLSKFLSIDCLFPFS